MREAKEDKKGREEMQCMQIKVWQSYGICCNFGVKEKYKFYTVEKDVR